MIEKIQDFFEENKFIKLDKLLFNYLNSIYVSHEQIYGFVQFSKEEEMMEFWEKAADELAVKLQSRLTQELNALKWDVYLIIIVLQDQIETSYRKQIENDRHYFRKIVITKDDHQYIDRIPFVLNLSNNKKMLIFDDNEFFEQFKECLQMTTITKLAPEFFEPGKTVDQLVDFFIQKAKRDELDEN